MINKFLTKLIIFSLNFFLISISANTQEFNFEGDWQIKITQEWTTMASTFKTTRQVDIKIRLPESNNTAEITATCHVTKQLSNYNVVLGRPYRASLFQFLKYMN